MREMEVTPHGVDSRRPPRLDTLAGVLVFELHRGCDSPMLNVVASWRGRPVGLNPLFRGSRFANT